MKIIGLQMMLGDEETLDELRTDLTATLQQARRDGNRRTGW
ncbi:hypothetical protein [Aeromicrobium sp. UC242_57]